PQRARHGTACQEGPAYKTVHPKSTSSLPSWSKISRCFCPSPAYTAILVPSGDHSGTGPSDTPIKPTSVTNVRSEPSGATVHSAVWGGPVCGSTCLVTTNAIFVPSGDQAGRTAYVEMRWALSGTAS